MGWPLPPLGGSTLLAIAAVALAGFVRGFAGLGAAMIIVPSLSILFSPVVAVPVMVLTDTACAMPMVVGAVRRCTWREVLPMLAGTAVLMPVGVAMLVRLDPAVLKVAMGGFVLAVTVVMAAGWRYRGQIGMPLTVATGGGRVPRRLDRHCRAAGHPVLAGRAGACGAGSGQPDHVLRRHLDHQPGDHRHLRSVHARGDRPYRPAGTGLCGGPRPGARAFGRASEKTFRRAALVIVRSIGASTLIAGFDRPAPDGLDGV